MQSRPSLARKIVSFFVFLVTISLMIVPLAVHVSANSLEDQLAQIERDLASIAQSKQNLQGQIDNQNNKIGQYSGELGKLNGQVQALQLDISQLDLQIKEVQVNIQILNKQIAEKKVEVQDNEIHIANLQTESDARIQNNYMDYRIHKSGGVDFFTVKNANTYFKDSQYNEIIQDDTNKVLQQLSDLKIQMEKDQADLEEKSINVLRNKAVLDEQHAQMDRKQADLKAQMNSYNTAIYNARNTINGTQSTMSQLSSEEAQKQAQRDQIRQQLFNSYSPISGSYVTAGTVIGFQGATGFAFGEHLHFYLQVNGGWANPCNYFGGAGGPTTTDIDWVLPRAYCGGSGQLQWPQKGSYEYSNGFLNAQNLPGQALSYHYAVDFANYTHGAPIYAAQSGYVCTSVDQYGAIYNVIYCPGADPSCNGYHGFKTGYWHLSRTLITTQC